MIDTALLKKIEISASALLHNMKVLRKNLSSGAKICCVLKSNAYGHGFFNVLNVIKDDADYFAVIDLTEAEAIFKRGIGKKIINIGFTLPEYADDTVRMGVIPHVYTIETIVSLLKSAEKFNKQVDFFIKVETGMNRCGASGEVLESIMELSNKHPLLNPLGFVTHFAQSDEVDSELTIGQIERFQMLRRSFQRIFQREDFSHAANTAAVFLYPDAHYQMVRTGLGLYGMSPSRHVACAGGEKLMQVLEFKSRIIQIHNVRKGESVSYGCTWIAPEESRVAIIPVGYADGYFRCLSNNSHVMIKGEKSSIVGRVCMNCFAVNVTGMENITNGTEVTLISRDANSGIRPEEIAERVGTINYEITTALSERIPRVTIE